MLSQTATSALFPYTTLFRSIRRQLEQVARLEQFEAMPLPEYVDYWQIPGLSHEIREKLTHIRPTTLGQAARISGVDRKSTRLNSSHANISYAVFCLK